jgi:phosphatidate cytidylyltransferase
MALLKRILTACVAIPTLLFTVQDKFASFIVGFLAITIALFEYSEIRARLSSKKKFSSMLLLSIFAFFPLFFGSFLFQTSVYPVAMIISAALLLTISSLNFDPTGLTVGSIDFLFYVIFLLPISLAYKTICEGKGVFVLTSIWLCFISDTGGLLFGSLFGKTKLLPAVSPNKTFEGFLCSFIFTCFCSLGFSLIACYAGGETKILASLSALEYLKFGMMVHLSGSVGDLVESGLKRHAKIKDSGTVIPGHGGILDRLDSLCPSFLIASINSLCPQVAF